VRSLKNTEGRLNEKPAAKTRLSLSKGKERKGFGYSKSFLEKYENISAHFINERPNIKVNKIARDGWIENISCDFENPRYREDPPEEKLKRWTKTTLEDLNTHMKEEKSIGFLEKKLITQYGKNDAVEGWDLDTSKSEIDLAAVMNVNKGNNIKRKKSIGKKN